MILLRDVYLRDVATLMDVVVFKCRKICLTGNRWNCALFTWPKAKTKIAWLSNCLYRADSAQNLPGPAPNKSTMYSECFRFQLNRFTYGGVIAEGVGVQTLRTQDTSNPKHFGPSAEVSVRHFGWVRNVQTFRHRHTGSEVSVHERVNTAKLNRICGGSL